MRAYRFLDGVRADTRAMLARRAIPRGFAAGDPLLHHGDHADEMFAIDSGRVKVWRTVEAGAHMTFGFLQDGDMLGIVGVTQAQPHSISATAQTFVETTVWSGALVRELAAHDAALSGGIAAILAKRTELMMNRLEEIFPSSIGKRVARTLVRLSAIVGKVGEDGMLELPLSRSDLAELAHTTVPTVSRLMSRWRIAGIIKGRRGNIVLSNLSALRAFARADA